MLDYESEISRISPLTLNGIAENCRSRLPDDYKYRPWVLAYQDRNFAEIFTEDVQADAYSAAYTGMHIGKLRMVFDKAKENGAFSSDIAVVDWGCGQGLATLALKEYLLGQGLAQCRIMEVILVEPSPVSLPRAKVNVSYALPGTSVSAVGKKLDDVVLNDVRTSGRYRVVHLFSNILDVDGISLKRISENLAANQTVDNFILCASPYYPWLERRYAGLLSYFKRPLSFMWRDSRSSKEKGSAYTYSLQVFKLEANKPEQIIRYSYYPAVHFDAGYALECVFDAVSGSDEAKAALRQLSAFKVYAPFEFGVGISSTVNPILAVLNNIVCRGLPTLCPDRVEESFAQEFGCSRIVIERGAVQYLSMLDKATKESLCKSLGGFGTCGSDKADLLLYAPLAMARLHKLFIEAIASGRLDFSRPQWDILVEERDVPFARKAFDVFNEMVEHICSLSQDGDLLRLPSINLTVVSSGAVNPAPNSEYDMVVCYTSGTSAEERNFNKYRARNSCVFYVCSSTSQVDPMQRRQIMTSDQIEYRELVKKNPDGLYSPIEENVSHLRYFLKLLFRKLDFRPGQLPILSRAMRNRSVIGLLPTGGGKSLTYQLAAMLQPGVTLVVDPLISLMSDQYEGLRRARIDCCAEINSKTANSLESENRMAASKLLFVFVSPERLCIMRFRRRMAEMNDLGVYFSYGVIDEVHCVSEWGHDFRFSYLHLGRNLFRYVKPRGCENGRRISLFGLTATASFDVLSDVERDLSGEGAFPLDADAIIRYENTNRLELQYRIVEVNPPPNGNRWDVYRAKNQALPSEISDAAQIIGTLQTPAALATIRQRFLDRENITDIGVRNEILSRDLNVAVDPQWTRERPNRSAGIVFCPHRQGSLGVNDTQRNMGVATTVKSVLELSDNDVATYIGGDVLVEQDRFLRGDASLMVSTKAFGMGIDKPNVRFTWHVNYSSSLESFVQEAGRAGRDRKMALATILFCPATAKQKDDSGNLVDIPYDLDVLKFFFDRSFKGQAFEKMVMYHLMSKGILQLVSGEELDEEAAVETRTVNGFLDELLGTDVGGRLTYIIATTFSERDPGAIWLQKAWVKNRQDHAEEIGTRFGQQEIDGEKQFIVDNYRDVVHKAIYRMCSIGVIDDYTENYRDGTLRIVAVRREDEEYYASLKRFLMRYYTETRADAEIAIARTMKGANPIQKCLAFLTGFIYSKVAKKRWQAMWDMDSFCREAVASRKPWLEANEDLKDFIYYYFNSKYAREGYTTDSGEPFSLTDDTAGGKVSSFDIVFKFMRVVDDDITGAEGSPRDNIKHLQGAVRLIRRSLTDANPALDLLNVFCLMFLKKEIEGSEYLKRELWSSYHQGYCDFRDSSNDISEFLGNMRKFSDELKKRNVIDKQQMRQLSQWQAEAEVVYQAKWLKTFAVNFTE